MAKISIVAVVSKRKRAIGNQNQLLWHLPEDLKRFKKITLGHPIIIGRKTYESIGKPLPGRTNIVVTREHNFPNSDVVVAHSLEEAIEQAKTIDQEEVFIIGGGEIYRQAISIAQKIYLTLVDDEKEADTFFPEYGSFNKEVFKEEGSHDGVNYTFLELERN